MDNSFAFSSSASKQEPEAICVCCGCQKVRTDHEQWEEPGTRWIALQRQPVTHGYCPPCFQQAVEEVRAFKARKNNISRTGNHHP